MAEGYYSTSGEGSEQSVTFMLVGGNNYIITPNVSIITYSHHTTGSVQIVNTKLKESPNDPAIGYTISGDVLSIWVKTHSYPNSVFVTLLGSGTNAKNKIVKEDTTTNVEPSGIVYI